MPTTIMVARKYMDSRILADHTWGRKIAWKTKWTGTVGRKRKNAVRTADRGKGSRGKGVFSSNSQELVTEVAPLVTEVPTSWNATQSEMGEKAFSRRMIVNRV